MKTKKRIWYLNIAIGLLTWACIIGLFSVWLAVAYLSGWGLVARVYEDGWFVKVLVIAWNACFWIGSLAAMLSFLVFAMDEIKKAVTNKKEDSPEVTP